MEGSSKVRRGSVNERIYFSALNLLKCYDGERNKETFSRSSGWEKCLILHQHRYIICFEHLRILRTPDTQSNQIKNVAGKQFSKLSNKMRKQIWETFSMSLICFCTFSDRGTACLCSTFLGQFIQWKIEIVETVSPSGEKERHA